MPARARHLGALAFLLALLFVARQSGARLVVVPQIPGALAGAADYFQWMNRLVSSVANALSAAPSK